MAFNRKKRLVAPLLVVARNSSSLNKFEQSSLQSAFNLKDFLEQTGQYDEVSIFQLCPVEGPLREWAKLADVER
jgi:hypothetical protein